VLQPWIPLEEDDAQIISGLTPKDHLDPVFWDSTQKLRPLIRAQLLKIAQDFYDHLAVKFPLVDVQITGSIASYHWGPMSDVDLHLILDMTGPEYLADYMKTKSKEWNRKDVVIYGHDVEITVEDANARTIVTSGIYSVPLETWVKQPGYETPDIDSEEILCRAECFESEIDDIIETRDVDRAKRFRDKLKRMRTAGLQQGGELGVEALSFKTLRRNGYLDKLGNFINKSYEDEMSLYSP